MDMAILEILQRNRCLWFCEVFARFMFVVRFVRDGELRGSKWDVDVRAVVRRRQVIHGI